MKIKMAKPQIPNQLRSLFVLSKYSFISNMRNRTNLALGIIFPLGFILAFGFLGDIRSYTVVVTSDSATGNQVYEQIEDSKALQVQRASEGDDLAESLKFGQIAAIIDIEETETEEIKIDVLTSDADIQDAEAVEVILKGIFASEATGVNTEDSVSLQFSTTEGREYKQIDFVLPGQLAFIVMTVGVFGLSYSLFSMRKRQITKRIFATPTQKWVIVFAEIISRGLIALLQVTFILTVGVLFFQFSLVNGIWTYLSILLISTLGLLISFGFGLFIASVSDDEDTVYPLANIIVIPQYFISGTFFPIDFFPEWLQTVSAFVPLTYINEALRTVSFEGADIQRASMEIGVIFLWVVAIYLVTFRFYRLTD
jgi:ABC-2 type transport system permease protein